MGNQSASWYIPGEGSQPAGPFTAEQLFQSWRAGKLSDRTKCWCEGMAQWLPLVQVEPFASAMRSAGAAGRVATPPAMPPAASKGSPTAPAAVEPSPKRSRLPVVLLCAGLGIALLAVGVAFLARSPKHGNHDGAGVTPVVVDAADTPVAANAADTPVAVDAGDAIEGVWDVQSIEAGERHKRDPVLFSGFTFAFQGDKLLIREPNARPVEFQYTIDPKQSPKRLDYFTTLPGQEGAVVVAGIYKVARNQLTLCVRGGQSSTGGRPTEFAAPSGSGLSLIVLKRLTTDQEKAMSELANRSHATIKKDKNSTDGSAIAVNLYANDDAELEHLNELLKRCQIQMLDLGGGFTDAGLEHLKGLNQLRTLRLAANVNGTGFKYLQELTQLQVLDLEHTDMTDAGMEYLAGFSQLRELQLKGTKVTGAGLKYLQGLTQLQKLDLAHARVTDAGLDGIKGLTNLLTLDLWNTQVTDAGMERLMGLTKLQKLNVGRTGVTDAGMDRLKGLIQLKKLNVGQTGVTGAGLDYLRGLPELEELDITETRVTDAGLGVLSRLAQLHTLWLSKPRVTEDGLEHLKGLMQLRKLELWGNWSTDAALEHLKGLTELRELGLHGSRLTNFGVEHLKEFTQLQDLELWDAGVTNQGVGWTRIGNFTHAEADKVFEACPSLRALNGKPHQSWLDESQHSRGPKPPTVEKQASTEPGTCIHGGFRISLIGIGDLTPSEVALSVPGDNWHWNPAIQEPPNWKVNVPGGREQTDAALSVSGRSVVLEFAVTKLRNTRYDEDSEDTRTETDIQGNQYRVGVLWDSNVTVTDDHGDSYQISPSFVVMRDASGGNESPNSDSDLRKELMPAYYHIPRRIAPRLPKGFVYVLKTAIRLPKNSTIKKTTIGGGAVDYDLTTVASPNLLREYGKIALAQGQTVEVGKSLRFACKKPTYLETIPVRWSGIERERTGWQVPVQVVNNEDKPLPAEIIVGMQLRDGTIFWGNAFCGNDAETVDGRSQKMLVSRILTPSADEDAQKPLALLVFFANPAEHADIFRIIPLTDADIPRPVGRKQELSLAPPTPLAPSPPRQGKRSVAIPLEEPPSNKETIGKGPLSGTWQASGGARFRIDDDGVTATIELISSDVLQAFSGKLSRGDKGAASKSLTGTLDAVIRADAPKRHPIRVTATFDDPDHLRLRCGDWPVGINRGKVITRTLNEKWTRQQQ